jgi:hypothetical protein
MQNSADFSFADKTDNSNYTIIEIVGVMPTTNIKQVANKTFTQNNSVILKGEFKVQNIAFVEIENKKFEVAEAIIWQKRDNNAVFTKLILES